MDQDVNMLDGVQPVALLLDELKSIVGQLEGYGVDSLVLCSASEDVMGSHTARQFTHQSNHMLNSFKDFCAGQRTVKQDGTSMSVGQELSFSIEKLISDTQTPPVSIEVTETVDNSQVDMGHTVENCQVERTGNNGHEFQGNTVVENCQIEQSVNENGYQGDTEVVYETLVIESQENVIEAVDMVTNVEEQLEKNNFETGVETSVDVKAEDSCTDMKTEAECMEEENRTVTLKVVKISGDITGPYVVIDSEKWNFLSLVREEKKKLKYGYKCGYCDRILKSLSMYREHCTKIHHAKIGYRCGCKEFFTADLQFNKHIEKCPLGQFYCGKCHDAFTSQQELSYHEENKHVGTFTGNDEENDSGEQMNYGDFPCVKCGIVFGHYNLLVQHNETFPYCAVEIKSPKSSIDDLNKKDIDYIDDDGKEVRTKYGDIVKMQTKPPYTCAICKYKNTKKSAFVRHLLIHIDYKTHECSVCGAKLKGKEGMAKHMSKHLAKPYKCGICGLPIPTYVALMDHMTKNCKSDLKCDMCGHMAASLSALKTHLMRHSGARPFKCEDCGKAFVAKCGLDRHIASIHSSEMPHKCDLCGKRFKVKDTLIKHRRIHQEPKYTCEYCGKKCTELGNMKKHMMTHTQEKPFICEVCGKKYARKSMLDTHKRLHTGERPYKCNQEGCEKSFRSHANLQQHIRNHSTNRPFICDVCGKGFKHPGRLTHHRKGHDVEYRWPCSYCSIKFKSLLSYKNHLARTHPERKEEVEDATNIKLYKCDLCSRMFGDKEDLTRHIYIHNNEKPFKCSFCNKGFNDKSNMRQHEKTHTGDKKHVCDICEKAFIHRRDLRSHKVSNHSENASQTKKRLRVKSSKAPQVIVVEKHEPSYEAEYHQQQDMVPVSVLDTFSPDSKPVIVQKEPGLHTLPLISSLAQTGSVSSDTLMQSMNIAQVDSSMDPYVLIGTLQVYDQQQQQQTGIQQTTYNVQPMINTIPAKLE